MHVSGTTDLTVKVLFRNELNNTVSKFDFDFYMLVSYILHSFP